MSILKNKAISYILIIAVFLLNPLNSFSADYLFKNKKTSYRIVVAKNASETEKNVAKELCEYLEQISGAEFELSNIPGKKNIYIGYDEGFAVFNGITPFKSNYEGFSVKKIGHDLVIYGGRERGTMYGVYRFLQEILSVRWYTPDFTLVPKIKKYRLRKLDFSEEPKIRYRYTDFFCAQDIPWVAHNMMNTVNYPKRNDYGIGNHYWGVHTLGTFLPASKYFEEHPEYFAYINSKRVDYGQPCLTNPDVLRVVIDRILSIIEHNPDFLIYDVSQNDNYHYCTCDSCVEIENLYGGHSGLMVWFVNNVAREVKKKYPDKYIGTFAYQYTRHAPTNIKPDDNVVIRLCDIECCFAHPLSSECNDKNAAFIQDLKDWSKLTNNLYIWDYIVNYSNYLAPFPNVQVLGPNLKTFSEYGAIGVYEEAQYSSLGNPFEELKCWVLSHLMWDPDLDTNKLVLQFINDYYGAASKDVLDYYNLCLSLLNNHTHFGCFFEPKNTLFTDEFVDDAYKILQRALNHAENEMIYDRVEKIMLQPMAVECERNPQEFYEKGAWSHFKELLLKYKPRYKAGISHEVFIKSFELKHY